MKLLSAALVILVVTLAGCAQVDRHGRPVGNGVSVENSPAPGPRPTTEQAVRLIEKEFVKGATVTVLHIEEIAFQSMGVVHSGWMVCARGVGQSIVGSFDITRPYVVKNWPGKPPELFPGNFHSASCPYASR
jgi:hypothetical protein